MSRNTRTNLHEVKFVRKLRFRWIISHFLRLKFIFSEGIVTIYIPRIGSPWLRFLIWRKVMTLLKKLTSCHSYKWREKWNMKSTKINFLHYHCPYSLPSQIRQTLAKFEKGSFLNELFSYKASHVLQLLVLVMLVVRS